VEIKAADDALRDRFALLGRLAGKIGHAVNNGISGAMGLISLAVSEKDATEREEDLREALRALTAAGRALQCTIKVSAAENAPKREPFGEVLDRITGIAGGFSRIGLSAAECAAECRSTVVAAAEAEHALLAALVMIADRAKVGTHMAVRCFIEGDLLHVHVEATGLAVSETADRLDDLQKPCWERIMLSCNGDIEIEKEPGRIATRIFLPRVAARS